MKVLIVEDDAKLGAMIAEILNKEGYTASLCADGEAGEYELQNNLYDLAVLDIMLPYKSGLDVLRESRAKGVMTPAIMLTALGDIDDKVKCFDAGADDYLTKPFDMRELLARVRAHIRRPAPIEATEVLRYKDLTYDTKSLTLQGPKKSVGVSKKLGALIEVFLKNEGNTLSRAALFARVWGMDADVEDAIIDKYIGFFRRRLSAVGSGVIIKTVRGVGYALD